ncbi:MAG: exodeoxyribonuclease VII small subunit [Phycisphaerae bacterium]|jgi:exodeoxyribonuclease VII small subunit|nr:exodeoxyribonuclease VII small subunit [Phycisphaerae bacterium]MDP7288094.1 exodeoxyribonuclease VII small subunit [Phycisphaerae bacterium]
MAKKKMSFEQALERIEEIVSQIEDGSVPLEESIEKYAEGTKLIDHCRTVLGKAEKKIQLLTKGRDQELEPAGRLPEDDMPED